MCYPGGAVCAIAWIIAAAIALVLTIIVIAKG